MWSAWSRPPTILIKDGFEVFPYCTEDLSVATRLVDAGCKVVMPWAAPIGSAKGIINRDALKLLRDRLPDITLVVDAGLGAPIARGRSARARLRRRAAQHRDRESRRSRCDGERLPARRRGRPHRLSKPGLMEARDFASPSTPVVGTPFWHAVS